MSQVWLWGLSTSCLICPSVPRALLVIMDYFVLLTHSCATCFSWHPSPASCENHVFFPPHLSFVFKTLPFLSFFGIPWYFLQSSIVFSQGNSQVNLYFLSLGVNQNCSTFKHPCFCCPPQSRIHSRLPSKCFGGLGFKTESHRVALAGLELIT